MHHAAEPPLPPRLLLPVRPASTVPARPAAWYRLAAEVVAWCRDEPCLACPLCHTRTRIVDTVFAPRTSWAEAPSDRAELMVVGRDPGREEDRAGFPFVGPSGEILASIFEEVRPASVAVGNVTRCIGTGPPTPESIQACAPYLDEDIARFRPRAFLLLGNEAAGRFDAREKITSLHGKRLTTRYGPAVAAFHPAYVLRNGMQPREAYRAAAEELRRLLAEPKWFG